MSMRDKIIGYLTVEAQKDPNIVFLSSDFGAPALDLFRIKVPDQFINVGISEQHMIDMAAGLAQSGKKVYCYAMAPFITARCYEQIKCSLSAMNLPVTLIGVGVGLGYDNTSMTHVCLEDIACMRAINNLEILTPTDDETAVECARLSVDEPAFRYLRLDRYSPPNLDRTWQDFDQSLGALIHTTTSGRALDQNKKAVVIACGAMVHVALDAVKAEWGLDPKYQFIDVLELIKIKPLNGQLLGDILQGVDVVITVEEQLLQGGMGAAVLEALVDAGEAIPDTFVRLGIRDGYTMIHGNRSQLWDHFGIGAKDIRGVLDNAL